MIETHHQFLLHRLFFNVNLIERRKTASLISLEPGDDSNTQNSNTMAKTIIAHQQYTWKERYTFDLC